MKNIKPSNIALNIVYVLTLGVTAFLAVKLFTQAITDDGDQAYKTEMSQNYINYNPILPEKLDFCGENVPLEYFDVREALEKELLKTMYWHSETFLYLKRMNRYFPQMRKILKQNNIPEDFLYLCVAESGMDHVVSYAKAVGFWQILEATGKECGLEINDEVDERYNIEKSTQAACKYFKQAYDKFGSWTLVAASYNAGQGAVSRFIRQQEVSDYYDMHMAKETMRYVYRILAYKLLLTQPEEYGFCFREKDLYKIVKTDTLTVDTAITDLRAFARTYSQNYKLFKMFNPWLRDSKLTNKNGKEYKIVVPAKNSRVVEK